MGPILLFSMKSFLSLLLLITLALGGFPTTIPGRNCPKYARDDLLPCVAQMDLDLDESITETELDTFFSAHASCIPTAVRATLTGAAIIAQCDTNADGNLTIADWNAPTGCIHLRSRQMALCRACDKCGLFNVLKKKN